MVEGSGACEEASVPHLNRVVSLTRPRVSGRGLRASWWRQCGVDGVASTVVVPWFPNNLARNSRAHLSNIEIRSLELQRLWRLLNDQANELRAKFWVRGRGVGRSVVGSFWSIARRLAGGVLRRWSSTLSRDVGPPKVSEKVSSWRGEQDDSRDGRMSLE